MSYHRKHSPFIYNILRQGGGGPLVSTMTGTLTVGDNDPRIMLLNTGSADRTVKIPDAEMALNGDCFEIRATGTSGKTLTVTDTTGTTLLTLHDGDVGIVHNARGTYSAYSIAAASTGGSSTAFTSRVTTTDGVVSGTAKVVGGRLNDFTSASDDITAATSNGSYVDFASAVPLPANTLKAGVRVSVLASIFISNAAAGSETLQTKLTIGPREVWTYRIDTASNAEDYGVNLTNPTTGSIAVTSDASATKPEIADAIAAAWNADGTCSLYATATSDGVDTVTFQSITDRYFKIAEDENAAKTTLTQTVSATTLVETTAVNQAGNDFQALDFELNAPAAPSATSKLTGVGSWMTNSAGTIANSVSILLPTDFATNGAMVLRAWGKWSASAATTTARMGFISARVE